MCRHRCFAEASSCLFSATRLWLFLVSGSKTREATEGKQVIRGKKSTRYCLCPGKTVRAQLCLQQVRFWATLCKRSNILLPACHPGNYVHFINRGNFIQNKGPAQLMVILPLVSKLLMSHAVLATTVTFLANEEDWGEYPLPSHTSLSSTLTSFHSPNQFPFMPLTPPKAALWLPIFTS